MLQIKPYLIFNPNTIIFFSPKANVLMNLMFPSKSTFYSYIEIIYMSEYSWL